MNSSPIALDLFCGGGAVCAGLQSVGFEVVGIDVVRKHHKNYPGHFIHADATKPPVRLDDFDFVWASPPCQAFSSATPTEAKTSHPKLIEPIRELLAGHPLTCIENVPGAPIRKDLVLTGQVVGLERIIRRRWFELSFLLLQPPIPRQPKHFFRDHDGVTISTRMCAKSHWYERKRRGQGGMVSNAEAREVMGIEHYMTNHEVGEAVPPAYAAFIGSQALLHLD